MNCLIISDNILLQLRTPVQYGGGNTEVGLETNLKFGTHGMLRQKITIHQILTPNSIVSTKRQRCQHIEVEWKFFCDEQFNMAAANPEVVSNLEINSLAERIRRLSPRLIDI
jgi:hypothetical protein